MLGLAITVAAVQCTQAARLQPVHAAAAHAQGPTLAGSWFPTRKPAPITTLDITARASSDNGEPPFRLAYTIHAVTASGDLGVRTVVVPFFNSEPVTVTYGPPCHTTGQFCIPSRTAVFTTLTLSRTGALLHAVVSTRSFLGTFTTSEYLTRLSL